MPPIDKITASIFSASNENTAALINAKFDFSLCKVEAPAEWASIGPALSRLRRHEAEIGPVHRTVRRLAALFESLIPNTPTLVSAYGKRVSSIIAEPSVNPHGSVKDGPFQSYVGADGTAMWAAATSGTAAIGIYLLACLLARAWDSRRAISIWVELFEARRTEVRNGYQEGDNVSEATLMSTYQDIRRDEFALWDASARSWLRSADQVQQWRLKQLELVTKDAHLNFASGASTYAKVVSSWTKAMKGMEDMLRGLPQQISDASILLAFSAWHLFPDLFVLSSEGTKVPFRDKLFASSALGTIGLWPAGPRDDCGIQWSLALSHLQHYGAPVEASGQASQPRVTFANFRLAILGSLFAKWGLNHRHYLDAAKFLCDIWEMLLESRDRPGNLPVTRVFGWFWLFFQASNDLLIAQKSSQPLYEDFLRLIAFGARRGSEFLAPDGQYFEPFFGLCDAHVIEALSEGNDVDCGVAYFRSIAKAAGLTAKDGIILTAHYRQWQTRQSNPELVEYASLGPHQVQSRKRNAEGDTVSLPVPARWFESSRKQPGIHWEDRKKEVEAKGEIVAEILLDRDTLYDDRFIWYNAPKIFDDYSRESKGKQPEQEDSMDSSQPQTPEWVKPGAEVKMTWAMGSWTCGLWLVDSKCRQMDLQTWQRKKVPKDLKDALAALKASADRNSLWIYMGSLMNESWRDSRPTSTAFHGPAMTDDVGMMFVGKDFQFSSDACKALHYLALTDEVFAPISAPTIPLDCLTTPMERIVQMTKMKPEPWLPVENQRSARPLPPPPKPFRRTQAFACLSFFDSGSIILDPTALTNVFAMSSGNSIYVSGVVLSDPSITVPENEIRHITGNIGRRGISMLIAPQNPEIRPQGNDYRLVNHTPYDLKRADNFKDTSLHLSFTGEVIPLPEPGASRTIDQEVFFVESAISVRDRGEWIADLDILAIDFEHLSIIRPRNAERPCRCGEDLERKLANEVDVTSIDTWEELLDAPRATGIVRAHGNWYARLAATSLLFQRQQGDSLGILSEGDMCLGCLMKDRDAGMDLLQPYEANLPQFCID